MWIFTNHGFVSVVRAQGDDPQKKYMARARRESDLKALFPRKKIFADEGTDYRYRVFLSDRKFKEMLLREMDRVDYTNFKGSIPKEANDYHEMCLDVWNCHFRYQHRFPYKEPLTLTMDPPSDYHRHLHPGGGVETGPAPEPMIDDDDPFDLEDYQKEFLGGIG